MEQCFRIAFCMMFLLTGYLQANPVQDCRIHLGDMGFDLLEGLSCEGTMNFTSPVMGNEDRMEYLVSALGLFKKGLEDAEKICTDENGYINQAMHTLKRKQDKYQNKITTESNFTMKVQEVQFEQFVKKTKDFVGEWNSNCSMKK